MLFRSAQHFGAKLALVDAGDPAIGSVDCEFVETPLAIDPGARAKLPPAPDRPDLGLVLSLDHNRREEMERFEFPILVLFATIGMMLMISASDLISLYLGLELQSLSLYVIAAFRRDSVKSTEAGLKYFVLGALSSGMLLYGASLVYGFVGGTGFEAIGKALAASVRPGEQAPLGILFGLVFVLAGQIGRAHV